MTSTFNPTATARRSPWSNTAKHRTLGNEQFIMTEGRAQAEQVLSL
jgi:hypothetical protein